MNQKRIRRLMRLMRLMPIYQKPNTSTPQTVYLNVAAKEFGACGARIFWMSGNRETLAKLRDDICPYPISMHSARYLTELAGRPGLIERIHAVQRSAADVYRRLPPAA